MGRLHPGHHPASQRLRPLGAILTPAGLTLEQRQAELQARALAQQALWVRQARTDFAAFMEYCFWNHETNGPFVQQWFHDEWSAAMDTEQRLLIAAPRNHGKCVPDDALTTMADGSRVRAVDLPECFRIRTWHEDHGWIERDALKWANKIQPIVEIQTRAGRLLRVSEEHPYWTQRGWVAALDLHVGDFVGCARGLPCGDKEESPDRAFLLGALLGDGGLTQASRVGLTIGNEKLLSEIRTAAAAIGWKITKCRGTDYDHKVTGQPGSHGAPVKYIRRLGLHGLGSHGKHVPAEVFTWTRQAVAALVSGYLETDGTVGDGAAGRAVEFYSVSRRLLADIQSLLLRLNVWSRLAPKRGRYKGAPHHSWRLIVGGPSIDDLATVLPPRGPKCQALHALGTRSRTSGVDLIPDGLLDRLLPDRFSREAPRLDNRRKDGHQRWKVEARARRKLAVGMRLLRNTSLGWDAIVAVHERPPERTWSIEVPGPETLIVDDAVTHNTSQIVGRVLWELGRDTNLRIKIACASDGRAKERLFEVVQNIQSNPRVREVFPLLEPADFGEWSKHKVIVKRTQYHRDASIEALGITSTATGGRADLIVADDVVDRRNALAMPMLRQQIKQAWFSDWTQLLEPNSRVWSICTLWHKDDLNHAIMENPAYRIMKYAVQDDFGSLWPEKWPEEVLRMRHKEIGSVEFNRAFRNQAVDTENAIVNPAWIRYADLAKTPEFMDRLDRLVYFTSYDTADEPTGAKEQDYTSACVIAVDQAASKIWVVDAWHGRHTIKAQAEAVYQEWRRYAPFRVLIEKAGLSTLGEWVLNEHPEMRPSVEVTRPRVSKTIRLLGVTPLLEKGQVIFSHHLDPNRPNWKPERGALEHELLDFPFARHDDMVDAFSQALLGARRYLLDAGTGEDDNVLDVRCSGVARDGEPTYPF